MREINPADVPQMMNDGTLEFGMELEFSCVKDIWNKRIFVGMLENLFIAKCPDDVAQLCSNWLYARFPLPALMDGDPVVVGCGKNTLRYKRIFKEYNEDGDFVVWDDGYNRWTICEGASISHSWKYGRPANKQELSEAGYTACQINEMFTRWGIIK